MNMVCVTCKFNLNILYKFEQQSFGDYMWVSIANNSHYIVRSCLIIQIYITDVISKAIEIILARMMYKLFNDKII